MLTNPEVASIISFSDESASLLSESQHMRKKASRTEAMDVEDEDGEIESDTKGVLKRIANSNYNVLIDTGALITGMSNEEVSTSHSSF